MGPDHVVDPTAIVGNAVESTAKVARVNHDASPEPLFFIPGSPPLLSAVSDIRVSTARQVDRGGARDGFPIPAQRDANRDPQRAREAGGGRTHAGEARPAEPARQAAAGALRGRGAARPAQGRAGPHLDRAHADLNRLDAAQANYAEAQAELADCLDLASDCYTVYQQAPDAVRRLFNQAFFERIYITDEDEMDSAPAGTFAIESPRV